MVIVVLGSIGFDKDHVDAFVVPGTPLDYHGWVYVVNQYKEDLQGFDEHKAVIGAEHADPSLRSLSLVASTYEDASGTGAVGVIGPTRMHYSRAIKVVDAAAQAVTRVLRDPN